MSEQFYEILEKTFGFKQFRPGQLEALEALMAHGRLLCIQPTGHGKSLLYQLPSVLLEGMTLVLSPLLALMQDQLFQLKNRFGITAASINSDQSNDENYTVRQQALNGKINILFISPEQLDNLERVDFLLRLPISLLVIDEAHCISTWGHDFRPNYRRIIELAAVLAKKNSMIKILALTATANQKTESDIKHQLAVDEQPVIVHREGMTRSNIRLSVIPAQGAASKLATLVEVVKSLEGCGLIYCATRENTQIVAEFLKGQEVEAASYHAGVDIELKRRIQQGFLDDQYKVIVATNALGMGIDKSNLRFIIHFDFPGSITAYYQEVGRCGRDGLPADGILIYDSQDSRIQKYFIDSAQPTVADFLSVLQAIKMADSSPNLMVLKRLTGLHPTRLAVILAELVEQQFLQKIIFNRAQVYQFTQKKGVPELIRYKEQYKIRTDELNAMQQYAESPNGCLMTTLCAALGDPYTPFCNRCSRCQESNFKSIADRNIIFTISSWLNRRTIPILITKKVKNTVPGIAILDGKLRSSDFVNFMQGRTTGTVLKLGISDNLIELIKDCLKDVSKHYKLSCIISIPSRTWSARNDVMSLLGNYLKIPVLNVLDWTALPDARQGMLLNNDQRLHNVSQQMTVLKQERLPPGTVLLFDDYVGSGATLNEAARALRDYFDNKIIPFTIASVKWRLGKTGMV